MTDQEHAKDNFLLYVPEIKHRRFRVTDTGRVVLEFEINPVKKLLARLVHRDAVSDIELDELASSAWLSMDGNRNILEVARLQGEKTGDDLDAAVARIIKFIRYIAKRGWIRFREAAKI
jgi:hypothetical protein